MVDFTHTDRLYYTPRRNATDIMTRKKKKKSLKKKKK